LIKGNSVYHPYRSKDKFRAITGENNMSLNGNTATDNSNEFNQEDNTPTKSPPKATKELKKIIHDAFDEIAALKIERKGINDDIAAKMSDLVAKGLNRSGLKAALSVYELGEGDRTDRNISYAIALEACKIKQMNFIDIAEASKKDSE
jgi:hypothetical protein